MCIPIQIYLWFWFCCLCDERLNWTIAIESINIRLIATEVDLDAINKNDTCTAHQRPQVFNDALNAA